MAVLVGANGPYDVDLGRLDETVACFRALGAEQLLLSSHEPKQAWDGLLQVVRPQLVHVRVKGNKWWLPQTMRSTEWGNERSPIDVCADLVASGITPYVVLLNEGDVELTPEWKADDPGEAAAAQRRYLKLAEQWIAELRGAFGGQVKLALMPLSQGGPPERFMSWMMAFIQSGLMVACDFFAEHCYTNGLDPSDPAWGGRWRVAAETLAQAGLQLPVHILECNTNGTGQDGSASQQAAPLAEWLATLDPAVVACASIFTTPGGKQDQSKPWWWFQSPELLGATRLQQQAILAAQSQPAVEPDDPKVEAVA